MREIHRSISILGRRQVKPRWLDDPMQIQDRRRWMGCRGRMVLPSLEGNRMAGGSGNSGSRIAM